MLTLAETDASARATARRRFSRKLFTYVLYDFLVILVCCLAAFLVLFLVAELFDDLEDFLRHDAPPLEALKYFLLLQPDHIVTVLPMSLLLATMYRFASLCKDNELTAIRVSGVSILQASLPVLLVALVLTGVQAGIAEFAAPAARQSSRLLKKLLTEPTANTDPAAGACLAYRNGKGRRDWLFRSFSADAASTGVRITQFREDRTLDWELGAASARRLPSGVWLFTAAVRSRFDASGEFMAAPPERHETLELQLDEDPGKMSFLFRLGPAEELSLRTSMKVLRQNREKLANSALAVLRTHFVYRLFFPLSCLIAVLIGVPMAVTKERGSAMRSAVNAIGIMALYYVSCQIFLVLGKNQTLPPAVAGSLPTLFFLAWGAVLALRKT